MSECMDAEKDWFPQRVVCYSTMQAAAANRDYANRHEKEPFHDGTFKSWSEKYSPLHPFHYDDGVRIWVHDSDLNPHDHFLGGTGDCEVCTPDAHDTTTR